MVKSLKCLVKRQYTYFFLSNAAEKVFACRGCYDREPPRLIELGALHRLETCEAAGQKDRQCGDFSMPGTSARLHRCKDSAVTGKETRTLHAGCTLARRHEVQDYFSSSQ